MGEFDGRVFRGWWFAGEDDDLSVGERAVDGFPGGATNDQDTGFLGGLFE